MKQAEFGVRRFGHRNGATSGRVAGWWHGVRSRKNLPAREEAAAVEKPRWQSKPFGDHAGARAVDPPVGLMLRRRAIRLGRRRSVMTGDQTVHDDRDAAPGQRKKCGPKARARHVQPHGDSLDERAATIRVFRFARHRR